MYHGEARNIKFGHQVNLIQRVQLGPLPQKVVASLPHNSHLQRGYCYQIWAIKTTP